MTVMIGRHSALGNICIDQIPNGVYLAQSARHRPKPCSLKATKA